MAGELKAMNPAINIEVLGINEIGADRYNAQVTSFRDLPWLQDTPASSTWTLWQAVWRDVRILDPGNRLVTVFNVTDRDLRRATNYVALRQAFLDAAAFVDTDGDGLLDEWEWQHFGGLSAARDGDADGDGEDNASEYAFCTDPRNAGSRPSFRASVTGAWDGPMFQTTFRRRAGAAVRYVVEGSTDLAHWSGAPSEFQFTETVRGLFDGSGAVESTWVLTPASWQPLGFLRVRAEVR